MMISSQILSIPPYISTSWKNIAALYSHQDDNQKFTLIVHLNHGKEVSIPDLNKAIIDSIFAAHAQYNESPKDFLPPSSSAFAIPLNGNIAMMQSATQHNPAQANAEEIPFEILEKITTIAKVLGLEDKELFASPEPHCNCPYCQISRAFRGESAATKTIESEAVADRELQFRSWEIEEISEKLYRVFNPLNEKEEYRVFLGDPIGCTCGSKTCEHIQAVLKS